MCGQHLETDSCSTTGPRLDSPEDSGERKSPQWADFKQGSWWLACAGNGSLLQAVFPPPLSLLRMDLGAGALPYQQRSGYSVLCVVTEVSLALSAFSQ